MSKPQKHDGVVYQRKDGRILWIRYRDRNGKRCRESTHTENWQEANRKLRERLQARDGNLLEVIRKGEALGFAEWVDSFLENYSKPPIRAHKTHEANMRCATHLKAAFPGRKLMDITADAIEDYLRSRLRQRVRVKVARGYRERGIIKSTTVHQEFRVLRRMLNVAVRKKVLAANPCSGVEFPVAVKGLFLAALRYLVGAGTDRISWSRVHEKHRADHYGDWIASLQGTDSDEEGSSGPSERGRLDPGLEDSKRHRRSSSYCACHRSLSSPDGHRGG